MPLTQEDIAYLQQQGINPADVVEVPEEKPGIGRSILSTLKAHGGGIAGGGAGTLAGIALAPETFGLSLAVPVIGGLLGSYAGQKTQNAVLSDETNQALALEAQKAAEAHPVVTGATDIAASALASGGAFSPKTLFNAGRGAVQSLARPALQDAETMLTSGGAKFLSQHADDISALKGVALQSAINPAIDTGVSLASGNGLPSGRSLLSDVAGGALFAKPSWLGKMVTGHGSNTEPTPEITSKGPEQIAELPQPTTESVPVPELDKTEVNTQTSDSYKNYIKEQDKYPGLGKDMKEFLEGTPESYKKQKELEAQLAKEARQKDEAGTQKKDGYVVTVQHPQIPGDKGYVQVDEYKNGENVRSSNPESLQKEGLDIPSTDELMKLPQGQHELSSIKNFPGPFTESYLEAPKEIGYHIAGGDATTGSVLDRLSKVPNHPMADMARQILNTSDEQSLKTPWNPNEVSRSNYKIGENKVSITSSDLHDSRVIMEEAIHSITSKKLNLFKSAEGAELKNRMDTYLKTGDNESIKDIIKAYYKTAENLGLHEELFKDAKDEFTKDATGSAGNADTAYQRISSKSPGLRPVAYAMGDLHEFVAHAFKNEQFQRLLNEMPSDVPNKSMWQRLVDSVRRLLGLDVKQGSMLEHVLRTSGDIMAQDRPENIKTVTTNKDTIIGSQSKETEPTDKSISVISKDPSRKGFLRPLEATFDKVDRDSTLIGQAGRNWQSRRDQFIGMKNTAVIDLQKYPKSEVDKVTALHREAYRTKEELPKLSSQQAEISKIISDYYGKIADTRREIGLKINEREGGKNQYYVPDQINDKTLDLFVNHALSPEAIHAENKWVDYVIKEAGGTYTPKAVRSDIQDYIAALGGKHNNYNSVKFGAIRKAAGYGLPEGLRELDGVKSLDKYGKRAASDLAMYMELESKPVIAASLKLKDPNTGKLATHPDADTRLASSTHVRDMMKWVTNGFAGTMSASTPKVNATVRLVNNAILGTATGLRDTVQMPVFALPYINKFSDLSAALKGILNFRNESRNALVTGARQPSIDKIQFDQINESPDRYTALVGKAATLMRKLQGREMIENVNRDITFSVGKQLAINNLIGAKAGHKPSMEFLKKFGTLVEGDVTKLDGDSLESALNQIAKNFTDTNQGTYGGAGLPAGIIDSQFAPFFALQKWSVEKSNVIYKDVVKPFIEGSNRLPLLTYTLGSVLSGAAIQQLNELLTGRKSQDPTVTESLADGSVKSVVGELATLMQLSSLGGIVGDTLKFASDVGLYGKTPRNIVSFPTATAALDLQEKTTDMVEALKNGENPWDVWKAYSLDVLTHNVQMLRMVANHTINKDDINDSDKFRDLRVYNQLEGKPNQDYTPSNRYMGIDAKEFKKTKDLNEAAAMLPELIKKAIKDSDGDAYELLAKLKSLKGNSYQTMPALDTNPIKFMRYIEYLKRIEGEQVATDRLHDYLTQGVVNSVKSAMVP